MKSQISRVDLNKWDLYTISRDYKEWHASSQAKKWYQNGNMQ